MDEKDDEVFDGINDQKCVELFYMKEYFLTHTHTHTYIFRFHRLREGSLLYKANTKYMNVRKIGYTVNYTFCVIEPNILF